MVWVEQHDVWRACGGDMILPLFFVDQNGLAPDLAAHDQSDHRPQVVKWSTLAAILHLLHNDHHLAGRAIPAPGVIEHGMTGLVDPLVEEGSEVSARGFAE